MESGNSCANCGKGRGEMNKTGLVERFNRPLRDFKGQKLCESCWNGFHYTTKTLLHACDYHKKNRQENPDECPDCRWIDTKQKITNCIGEPCECNCREMLAEKHPRIKKDKSAQANISELVGDDVIQIGKVQTKDHRDEG